MATAWYGVGMDFIGTRAARDTFTTLVQAALEGRATGIERDGVPVAKICPLTARDLAEWRRAQSQREDV